jgi:uncharacterized protein YdaL
MRTTKKAFATAAALSLAATAVLSLNMVTADAATTTPAATTLRTGKAAPGAGTAKTLILYDTTNTYGWLGEVYATQTANLSSHFGSWAAEPVSAYKSGDLNAYTAVIYIGSTYDEPIPATFLADVTATTKSVTWIYDNIWELTNSTAGFAAKYGFTSGLFDYSDVSEVDYKGTALTRDTTDKSGIMNLQITDPAKVTTVATAVRPDGTTFPWAVRSGNFTYVGEIPYAYVTSDDRYLAFSDMLFDVLGSTAAEKHRGLIRIEDVGPDSDPAELKAIADYLSAQRAPFSVAVYPRYRDPKGVQNGGKAQDYTLLSKPKVVAALTYMVAKGGTLIMHGYTHQYSTVPNPYDGVSANDFEFYSAHIDAANNVVYDGPVPVDSAAWAAGRMVSGELVFAAAGLGTPKTFEFPHYAASAVDYAAANTLYAQRYDRGLYFPGVLTGAKPDYTKQFGQFFPYTVRDVYGTVVVPENIGNVEPEPFNNHPPRLPADILASSNRNLAVRDGVASFFYHPYLGTSYLQTLVTGIKAQGYTFVTGASMVAN